MSRAWLRRLEPLRLMPGAWRSWEFGSPSSARNTASRLRHGRIPTPAGRWQFTTHGIEVHAKYLGESEDDH